LPDRELRSASTTERLRAPNAFQAEGGPGRRAVTRREALPMRALLISTYELGRQPFGIASAASWLQEAGAGVDCRDLAVQILDEEAVKGADLIAFYVPMHTATRIAIARLPHVRQANPGAHLCFFGLYAPVNEEYLRKLGVQTILGGEFEEGLRSLGHRLLGGDPADGRQEEPVISLHRQRFLLPARTHLPLLDKYARVDMGNGEQRITGYTEATRGCRHVCRHCPIVPIYGGRFRVVQRDVVMADIRQQVAAGAHHITFGDPDFFNGPGHALKIVHGLHEEFPDLSYDVTIKVEHLHKHRDMLPVLRDTGCLFVTSAVEAVDEATLARYEKNHTRQDFIEIAEEFERIGLGFNPTFVTFSPWTTLEGYGDLLALLHELNLVDNVAPIQLAIRLLIPRGSRLLELQEVEDIIGPFDESALCYPWKHPDSRVDGLHQAVLACVEQGTATGRNKRQIFADACGIVRDALPVDSPVRDRLPADAADQEPRAMPGLTEPWYCCAEPTEEQLLGIRRSQV
jgi:hypothetical protein